MSRKCLSRNSDFSCIKQTVFYVVCNRPYPLHAAHLPSDMNYDILFQSCIFVKGNGEMKQNRLMKDY